MAADSPRVEAAKELLARRRARAGLLAFLGYCWWMPHPLLVGQHTRAIADRLTAAVDALRHGVSTFLWVAVPFRHGKSDLVSRALPAWFLGQCADMQPDCIMSGYGASLVQGFSRRVKAIMQTSRYQRLFPGVQPGRGTNSASEWQVAGSSGTVVAQGLGGALTGKGGSLIIVDDYCKSRAEARSEAYRDRTWDAFTNDLLTRRAPVSIVVVCATPWHVDDLRGRIHVRMRQDSDFPRFEELRFPARTADGFLFHERFDDAWYRSQYATLGKLSAGLLDCEPTVEGGNRFAVERIVWHDDMTGWPIGRETRGWDLASSTKQRDGDDPDWTVGVRGLVTSERVCDAGPGAKRHHIWIRDVAAVQAEASARNDLIRRTAIADGPAVCQAIESYGAYKDAYTTLRDVLSGVAVVRKSQLPGDKSAKLAPLEPSFEGGLVHVLRGKWTDKWQSQFGEFPDGRHDDFPDATGVMYHDQVRVGSGVLF